MPDSDRDSRESDFAKYVQNISWEKEKVPARHTNGSFLFLVCFVVIDSAKTHPIWDGRSQSPLIDGWRKTSLMSRTEQNAPSPSQATPPLPAPLAPLLMMVFWMVLGGAAGIKLAQSTWRLLDWGPGEVSIAVPVGGVVGVLAGALLGSISNPNVRVLLMAMFAGASAGAVSGEVFWGEIGEIVGQVAGILLGGITWAIWLFVERNNDANQQDPQERVA